MIKLDGKDELPSFMIDEYLVKSELSEDQYNTEERANHFTFTFSREVKGGTLGYLFITLAPKFFTSYSLILNFDLMVHETDF